MDTATDAPESYYFDNVQESLPWASEKRNTLR